MYNFSHTSIRNPLYILLLLFIYSCGTSGDQEYQVNVTIEPVEAGTVTSNSKAVAKGEIVELIAVPNEHWIFKEWIGDNLSDGDRAIQLLMSSDVNIKAVFEKVEYPITIIVEGQGRVEEEIVQQKTTDYTHATILKLKAIPEFGWEFAGWSGAVESQEEEIELVIEGPTEIRANFRRVEFNLKVHVIGDGTVVQERLQSKTTEEKHPFESEVKLTATPAVGWEFLRWSGDAAGTEPELIVQMLDEKEITAEFKRIDYNVTVNIEGEGSVDKEMVQAKTTQAEYPFQTVLQLTAKPSPGWQFLEWQGDASGSNPSIQLEVDQDKEVLAKFVRGEFGLTISVKGSGIVEQKIVEGGASNGGYLYQTKIELKASPQTGWEFIGWSGDLAGNEPTKVIEIDNNKTVEAIFTPILYELNVQVVGSGTFLNNTAATQSGKFAYGTTVELTAMPSSGWAFQRWSGGVISGNNPVQIFIDGDKNVTVEFKEQPPRLLQLGDSITNGDPHSYRFRLYNRITDAGLNYQYVGTQNSNPAGYSGNWNMIHEGHNGYTTRDVNLSMAGWLQSYGVDMALIHLGTNDILNIAKENLPNSELALSESNMQNIIDQLRSQNPSVRVYVAQIIPIFSSTLNQQKVESLVSDWNVRLQTLAGKLSTSQSPVAIVNMHNQLQQSDLTDGIHPNQSGATKMADRWFDALQ